MVGMRSSPVMRSPSRAGMASSTIMSAPGKKARFVRNFMLGASSIEDAVQRYVQSVKNGSFPADEHSF